MRTSFIINHVRFEIDGSYGDDEGAIYIYDNDTPYETEIVMWDMQEWKDDPSLVYTILEAIEQAQEKGIGGILDRFRPYQGIHKPLDNGGK